MALAVAEGRTAPCGPCDSGAPTDSGVYLLELGLAEPLRLSVGGLGELSLPPGVLLYAGSAQRGLLARVGRHFTREKRTRWHIDYVTTRRQVVVRRAWVWPLDRSWECRIVDSLLCADLAERVIPRFGASDCRCGGHLLRVKRADWLSVLSGVLGIQPAYIGNDQR